MIARRRLDADAIPDELPEYMTVKEIARVMRVEIPTVIRYSRTEPLFPERVRPRGALYRRDDVAVWIRGRQRKSRPSTTPRPVDAAEDLPEYLSTEDIAELLGVKPATVIRYAVDEWFPPRAFGASVVIYRGSDVLTWLRQRAAGLTSSSDASLADPARDPLSIDDIASIMGISGSSLRTLRSQRDAATFPKPLIDPQTGRPYRPARFARIDTRAYLLQYAQRLNRSGRHPSQLCQHIIDKG